MFRIWPLLDIDNLDSSWPALEAALNALIATRRREVADLAASYLRGFRQLEGVTGDLNVVLASVYDPEALAVSLRVTGPVAIKTAIAAGATAEAASQRGLVAVTGAASRVVLNGGRDTVTQTVEADRQAIGYMRRTHGKTCAFCAMLASRGPVYKSRKTAGDPRGGAARFHDHCDCTIEPIYSRTASWPAASERFEQLWIESTIGLSGQDARNAFRIAYEATL